MNDEKKKFQEVMEKLRKGKLSYEEIIELLKLTDLYIKKQCEYIRKHLYGNEDIKSELPEKVGNYNKEKVEKIAKELVELAEEWYDPDEIKKLFEIAAKYNIKYTIRDCLSCLKRVKHGSEDSNSN